MRKHSILIPSPERKTKLVPLSPNMALYHRLSLNMKISKTLKCRMVSPIVKKAMVLQIVLSKDVYTSEMIKDVESVSRSLEKIASSIFSGEGIMHYEYEK